MLLIDHVSITVARIDVARPFYEAVMTALNVIKVYDRADAIGFGTRCNEVEDFHSYLTIFESATANLDFRRHWCFKATTRAQVSAFHTAGLANGGRDDGAPGLRPQFHSNYFAAFLHDPFGNRIEAVCHRAE
jgi:catechol 2,3-dioxygenase-like lactoylglutathione lyase family enzyme